ncbi:MAG TPA: hypothetical protein VL793_10865 [Patescibacteria group bacterium]|nr:hypothetical protein [Patescibacteria group bacterium]
MRKHVAAGTTKRRAVLAVLLLVSFRSWFAGAADFLSAGFLYDKFYLTLTEGNRTEAMGPLFYQEHAESQRTWAVPPLISFTTDEATGMKEFDILYPLLTYDRYGEQYRWQLMQLLSLAGGPHPDETSRDRFTVFPLYFQQRSSDPSKNYTAIVPFYGHLKNRLFRDEIYFVMFPIYGRSIKKGVVTDNYLFPIFHLRHGPGLTGWQFWPLVGHEHKDVTMATNGFNDQIVVPGHDSLFVLWPIFFNDHTGTGTTNETWQQGALPLYSFERSAQRTATTVIWPFFSRIDDRVKKYREWDAPWPLIEYARGEGKTTTRFWPLFSQAHTATLEDDFYLWPVYKYNRARLDPLDRRRVRIVFFLFSDTVDRNTETGAAARTTYLWPFFIKRRDLIGNTRLQVFAPLEPFVQGSHKIARDYSPLWSVWRQEASPRRSASSQSLLWNLYHRQTSPGHKKVSLFFGLFQYQSGPEGARTRLFYIPVAKHSMPANNHPSK